VNETRDEKIVCAVGEAVRDMLVVVSGATSKMDTTATFTVNGVEVHVSLEVEEPWRFGRQDG
jgi:hypothetical protein